MVSVEYSEAITETLDILKHTKKEDVDKISSKFIDFLNANASKTYKPELDHTKNIKDMQLKHKTKAILAIIYKKYWCDSEKQEQFNRVLKENEIKREKELRKKYNPDNLFKNSKSKIETVDNSVSMVEYKESIFIKIKNWFKQIFNK
jgi:hypothetical protein